MSRTVRGAHVALMRVVLAILGAMILGGCASSERPAMWHGDVRFTAEERAAIVEGEAWIAAQGGHEPGGVDFDYVVSDEAPVARTIRRERGPGAPQGTTGECVDGAVYLGLDGAPSVNEPPLDAKLLPGLTAHEMAHCRYGFVDAYRPGDAPSDGIMRSLFPMRWTDAEEAQCERTRCRDEGR